MTPYPTVEEALDEEIHWSEELEDGARYWKQLWWKGWKTRTTKEQFLYLEFLVQDLANEEGVDSPNVLYSNEEYLYIPSSMTIVFGPNPSVVSALHELGHHLYGESELEACAFSLQLFKTVFPKDFAKLKPDGHMMKKTDSHPEEHECQLNHDHRTQEDCLFHD